MGTAREASSRGKHEAEVPDGTEKTIGEIRKVSGSA